MREAQKKSVEARLNNAKAEGSMMTLEKKNPLESRVLIDGRLHGFVHSVVTGWDGRREWKFTPCNPKAMKEHKQTFKRFDDCVKSIEGRKRKE